jgi:acyl-CoA synthetase (AMP-forming)/AMP-acid ligase II
MLGLMTDQHLLLINILKHAARVHGSGTVVTCTANGRSHSYNYRQAFERAGKLANALIERGVSNGGMVATLAWNNSRHFEIYYATAGIGAVCHTINPRLSTSQIAEIIEHAGDELLFVEPDLYGMIEPLVDNPGFPRVIILDDASGGPHPSYERLMSNSSELTDWPPFDERTAASLCYTSGTTGRPKGILYSHRSSVLHAMSVCRTDAWAISGDDIVCSFAPMFHVNAWGLPFAVPLCGADLILPGPHLKPDDMYRIIEECGVTLAFGVPTVWHDLLSHMERLGLRFTTMRRVVISGSALPPDMLEIFETIHGVEVLQAWGMTESSPMGMVSRLSRRQKLLPREEQTKLKLQQGRPVFGIEANVLDMETDSLAPDFPAKGECAIRGLWVASSYFRGEADTNAAFLAGGWFRTGDVAQVNEEGFFHIVDRKKDAIKSGGEWISSIEIENAARSDQQVLDCAAVGIADPKWGERPVLAVVPRDVKTFDSEILFAAIRQRLQKWAVPDRILLVAELPRSGTGKLLKVEIRERVAAMLG